MTMTAHLTGDPRLLLATEALYRRPCAPVDLAAEASAMRSLTGLVADNPPDGIARFLDIARDLCNAGSAGLSVLTDGPDGRRVFFWDALSGAYADYVGGTTPADFSPCGLCLEVGRTILLDRPSRVFTYLDAAEPPIVEGMIVPLYDANKVPLGTLWIVSHDETRRFDGETARRMEQFAGLMVLAIRLRQQDRRLGATLQKLESQADRASLRRGRAI